MTSVIERLGERAAQHWGLVTTGEAAQVGVDRHQMSRLCAAGVLTRVQQGVYRMAGVPESEHEMLYATWLALSDAGSFEIDRVPGVVVGGTTAAIVQGVGDFFPDGADFLVPRRRATRLPGVRLRTRELQPVAVAFVEGLPTLTLEALIADLVEQWTDMSLVADTLRDAKEQGRFLDVPCLEEFLDPLARRHDHATGADLYRELREIAGLDSVVST